MSAGVYIPPIEQQADTGGVSRDLRVKLGENLSARRRQRGLSPDEVAALAEIGPGDLDALERGDGDVPHIETLVRLAAALEADPDDLLAGIEWAPESGRWRISSG